MKQMNVYLKQKNWVLNKQEDLHNTMRAVQYAWNQLRDTNPSCYNVK